jgi:hypothetical protein
MSVPAKSAQPALSQSAQPAVSSSEPNLPSAKTLLEATKIALNQDRAIMLDYYQDSCVGKVFLGKDSTSNDRVLIKSKEEYTSLIKKMYKSGTEYIILTENSLYIISSETANRTINLKSLQEANESN